MRTLPLAIAIAICCQGLTAQTRLRIDRIELCSYYGETIRDDLYAFESDQEASSIVAEIMRAAILPQNFSIMAANVPNAAAVIKDGKRLILYNQSFVRDINRKAGTGWASRSILAHEIGHHLAGHTLDQAGSRPDTELEADKFSGGTLYRMRATLEDAKAAMQVAGDTRGSSTHPPKTARLAAIHNGWIAAQEVDGQGPSSSGARVDSRPAQRDEPRPSRAPPTRPERVVNPDPPPNRGIDLDGAWRHPAGSVSFSYSDSDSGSDVYRVTDHNPFGLAVGQGVALLRGSTAMIRIDNTVLGVTYTCAMRVSGSRMTGLCRLPAGNQWHLHLSR